MENSDVLKIAFQLVEKHGQNAERIVADRIDKAMETADAQAHDEWCLVAEAIAVLTRGAKKAKIKPVARRRAA